MLKLPLERPCPKCNAKVNELCAQTGKTIRGVHAERWAKKPLYEAVPPIEQETGDSKKLD